jgi:hypothetical protein
MKTFKFLIVLCVLLALAINAVNAQPPVVKLEFPANVSGQAIPCTGDKFDVGSYVLVEMMIMPNKTLVHVRNAVLMGTPSGKEYVINQVASLTDDNDRVSHVEYRCDGKLVAVGEIVIRVIENANGEVTADIDHVKFICK